MNSDLRKTIDEINSNYEGKENTREYEELIAKVADEIKDEDIRILLQVLSDNNHNFLALTSFFILFTKYRHDNQLREMKNLFDDYGRNFISYDLYKHIDILCKAKLCYGKEIKELINYASLSAKSLENYVGFQHHLAELIARYYEINLDEVNTPDGKKDLEQGYDSVIKAISGSIKEYHKFFCTKGRLEALLGRYDDASRDINHGINLAYGCKNSVIAIYEDFLSQIVIIKAYYTMQNKIVELDNKLIEAEKQKKKDLENQAFALEKQKLDNYKIISLMSGAIAFLLGGIKIFESISDPKKVAILMTMYAGLFFIMLGLVLIFTKAALTVKEEKKSFIGYIIGIIPIAVGLFVFFYLLSTL